MNQIPSYHPRHRHSGPRPILESCPTQGMETAVAQDGREDQKGQIDPMLDEDKRTNRIVTFFDPDINQDICAF